MIKCHYKNCPNAAPTSVRGTESERNMLSVSRNGVKIFFCDTKCYATSVDAEEKEYQKRIEAEREKEARELFRNPHAM